MFYEYLCEKCKKLYEIQHSMSCDDQFNCEKCKKPLVKQISMPYFASKGFKPTREENKENDHKKKVKDPERARRNRIKAFGSSDVGVPKDKPDPRHIIKQGRTLGGRQMEVDKTEIIKALANDPLSVKLAQDSLKKKK